MNILRHQIRLGLAISVCTALLLYNTTTTAGFFDDLKETIKDSANDVKENIKEEKEEVKKSVNDKAGEKVQEAAQEVNKAVDEASASVSTTINGAIDNAARQLKGNANVITSFKLEGVVVGSDASSATSYLKQNGYKMLSSDPWLFQKGDNTVKLTASNKKVNSIEMDGIVTGSNDFIKQESLRIKNTLGKPCPPNEGKRTWLCSVEGEKDEYFLELNVRRNKYSYIVEGTI